MSDLFRDVRLAVRMLGKYPNFTILALLILAIGIGASSAIFSVVQTVLLRPLPYPEPERLVTVWETRLDRGITRAGGTEANFWDVQEQNTAFAAMGALKFSQVNLTGGAYPQRLSAGRVSVGFFAALQPRPVVGRVFQAGEDQPDGQNNVVLLSNAYWQKQCGGNPAIVGSAMTLDGTSHKVIGVLPPGDLWMDSFEVYVPLVRRADASRVSFELPLIGRLAPGVSFEAAKANLASVCRLLEKTYPTDDKGIGMGISAATEWTADPDLRRALWVLFGAVGVLLLLAVVNLSNLMLTRAIVRRRETAVRIALGADRVRLARQMLTEALVLSLVGAGLGLLLAHGAVAAVKAFNPGEISRLGEAGLNGWVLAFSLGVSLVVGVIMGLVPALFAPASRLVPDLREGERTMAGSHGQKRLRSVLVAMEVALSLVLLIGAGLLIRSFTGVLKANRGFATANRLVFTVSLPPAYDAARIDDMRDRFIERIRSLSQVKTVACVSTRPLVGGDTGMAIVPVEYPRTEGEQLPWASWRLVTGDFFRAMDIPLLRGRTFTDRDRQEVPVPILISDRLALRLFPGQNPVGRRMSLWAGQGDDGGEVIGVVGSMRERGLDYDPTLAVYMPYRATRWASPNFVVHAGSDPMAQLPALRGILAEIDPTLPISDVRSLDEIVGSSVTGRRFNMLLMAVLAGCALSLALAGIWGIQTHFVASQRAEIGIRMALGARQAHVLGAAVTPTLRSTGFGIALGLAASFALSRAMASLLFGITASDVVTYFAVTVLLASAALLSCLVPALRALRVDPASTLRGE